MPDTSVRLAQVFPLMQERMANGESVQFTPHGTSMRPTIYGGRDQVVLAALPEKLKKYDLPLYRRDDGQFVLHRIVKVGQTYTCIGDNQFIYEPGVRQDQMLALATGFYRKGKFYRTDSFGYHLYSRLWCWSRPVRYVVLRCWGILRAILRRVKSIFVK